METANLDEDIGEASEGSIHWVDWMTQVTLAGVTIAMDGMIHCSEGMGVLDVALIITDSPPDQGDLEVMGHPRHLLWEEVMEEIMGLMILMKRVIDIITLAELEGWDLIDHPLYHKACEMRRHTYISKN